MGPGGGRRTASLPLHIASPETKNPVAKRFDETKCRIAETKRFFSWSHGVQRRDAMKREQSTEAPPAKAWGSKEIAVELARRISTGVLPDGALLPTERVLQAEFGASRSTVRRALARLAEGGSARNVPSRGVVALGAMGEPIAAISGSRNVALIDGSSFVLRVLYVRMSEMLRERGYHLVHLGGNNAASMEEPLQYAADHGFAGALLWPFRGFPDTTIIGEAVSRLPVVMLNHPVRGVEADLVTFDYLEVGAAATRLLVEGGARRIGVTGMLDMLPSTQDRFSGYLKTVFEAGQQPWSNDFLFTHTSAMEVSDVRPLIQRLREDDAPDGLLVLQDEFVVPTVETALQLGKSVPGDLRLATIGDEIDLTVDSVGMSTIALDWDAMAALAVERGHRIP
ncbi:GntR family transcriptional regulator, partial [bacterium]